jgi:hypothetical protein
MDVKILLQIGGRLAQYKHRKIVKFDDVDSLCAGIDKKDWVLITIVNSLEYHDLMIWYDIESEELLFKLRGHAPGTAWTTIGNRVAEKCHEEIRRRYAEWQAQSLAHRVKRLPERFRDTV